MRVLWLNEHAAFMGGAEHYIADAAKLLRDAGVRSTLLYGVGGGTEPSFTACFDEAFPRVQVREQVQADAPDLIYVHRLADESILTELLLPGGPPVVRFFHDHALFCLRDHKYRTLGHETCTRTVGLGCYPCLGFVNRRRGWPPARLRTVGGLLAQQRATMGLAGFVVGSQYMKSHVTAHGFDPARVHVIPPFARMPDEVAAPERDPHLLLAVGALLWGKGIDLLLKALTRLPPNVRLSLVGEGHQRALFEEMAARLGLRDRVHFAGRLPRHALSEVYRRAACLVMASRTPETFGLVGPEALLHGTPVVASNVGGIGEWLVHEETGLFFPSGDADALARAIGHILADPDWAGTLAQQGRTRCLNAFSPERHVRALSDLFRSLTGS